MTSRNLARRRFAGPRRARQWANVSTSISVIGVTEAQKGVFDLQSALEVDLDYNLNNVTASAIRLNLSFRYVVGSTLGDLNRGSWGIRWCSNDAVAAGAASLPNPVNDSADWMAHGSFAIISESTSAHVPRGGNVVVENNSMRKQGENNSSLCIIIATVSSAFTMQVDIGGRVLFLLP